MRLTEENKRELLQMVNDKISTKDIINKFKISRATYYRIVKEENDNTKSQLLDEENSQETTQEVQSSYNEVPQEAQEETSNENETVQEEEKSVFNKDLFIKELHNDNNNDNELNLDTESETQFTKKDIKREIEHSIIKHQEVSFKKDIVNRSNIIDTIKNVNNAGTIDELKEKRSLIIIIRQYINTFPKELNNIYGKKNEFEKKLFIMSIDQLKIILENIRVELNLSRNKEIFITTVSTGLKAIETVSNYSGYDVHGLEDELMKDPDFILDLQIISCEIDMSQYINPKTSALLKVVKKMYQKNKENEIKKQIDNVLNDQIKLDKIKNLK